ncbi:FAD-dependent oxidoreductase [Desulforamulus profundi]|uniref:FAD-dependent oxidoreductase n=1 Tax=Desulforamulus profundi TaxID=1383067 RepID=UPI0015D4B71B|nr:FAD-dependent oxidoreductase [Desulforamulus profundi]
MRDEIARIKSMGVEIRVNSPVKGEQGIRQLLKEGYSAVFLGTGAWQGSVPIAGAEQYRGVYDGITFLKEINQVLLDKETPPDLSGKKVVVVGGGNVAIDAARVSLRLGAAEVRIVYRRTREEMPALVEEIVDAEHEGIIFDFLVSPVSVAGENEQVSHLTCLKNKLSEPDASGRRKPVSVEGSEYNLAADLVVFATGQQPDLSYLEFEGVEVTKNRITVDPLTLETSLPGVFAGGDAVTGPASAVKAMAAGKQAAAAIDAYLRGEQPSASIQYPLKRKSINPMPVTAEQKSLTGQVKLHDLYMEDKQHSFEEIMQAVSKEAAAAEAARCLRCDMCIACGRCVEVCQQQVGAGALQLGYVREEEPLTDFLRPGEKCIGCGTCSINCPTGAITAEDRNGFREMRMCGGLMSRLELIKCQECDQPITTQKHINFILNKNENDYSEEHPTKRVCPECSRLIWSKNIYGMRIV